MKWRSRRRATRRGSARAERPVGLGVSVGEGEEVGTARSTGDEGQKITGIDQ
jgi:hypothetical protein